MAIIRTGRTPTISPWRELEEMSSRLNRFFVDDAFPTPTNGGLWAPPVNVAENGDQLVLTAELPGVRQEDVEIDVENNVLTIRGEKREERTEGEEGKYHLWERRYGSFQRSFTLPRTVKADDIRATFKDGILTVQMPKAPEAKGRKIAIATEA